MSLITTNEQCRWLDTPHARLLAAAYIPNRGKNLERMVNGRLDMLQNQLFTLAERLRPYSVYVHDTDCDGTTHAVQRVWATSADAAERLIADGGYYYVSRAIPEDDFLTNMDEGFYLLDPHGRKHYLAYGYASLGFTRSHDYYAQ